METGPCSYSTWGQTFHKVVFWAAHSGSRVTVAAEAALARVIREEVGTASGSLEVGMTPEWQWQKLWVEEGLAKKGGWGCQRPRRKSRTRRIPDAKGREVSRRKKWPRHQTLRRSRRDLKSICRFGNYMLVKETQSRGKTLTETTGEIQWTWTTYNNVSMLNFISDTKKYFSIFCIFYMIICGYVREYSCSSDINTEKFRGAMSAIPSNGSAKLIIQ